MKEKTRKTLAIGLLAIGLFVPLVGSYIPVEWWVGGVSGMSNYMWGLVDSFWLLIRGCFLFMGIWVLNKLLNAVTRRFFYRLFIGLFICVAIGFVIRLLLNLSDISVTSRIWSLESLAVVIILMSGAGIIGRNYTLDAYLSSKLRLFQAGVVLTFIEIAAVASWGYANTFDLVNNLIGLIGYLCLFLGLVGIIRSDLLSGERKGEVFSNIGGGWFSRPVIGGVCFSVFLLIAIVSSVAAFSHLLIQ